MITLTPGEVTLVQLEQIWRGNDAIALHSDTQAPVEAAAAFVCEAAVGGVAVYGVNTGFGKLANVPIAKEQTATLQRNLVLSHCCGVVETLVQASPVVALGRVVVLPGGLRDAEQPPTRRGAALRRREPHVLLDRFDNLCLVR